MLALKLPRFSTHFELLLTNRTLRILLQMRALDFHRRNSLDSPFRRRRRTLPVVFCYLFDEFVKPWPEEIISRVQSARDWARAVDWAWAASVWDVNGLEGVGWVHGLENDPGAGAVLGFGFGFGVAATRAAVAVVDGELFGLGLD